MTVTLNGRKATVSTTYDGVGRVASQQLGNGASRRLAYDVRGWLTGIDTELPLYTVVPLSNDLGLMPVDTTVHVWPPVDPFEPMKGRILTETIRYADGPTPRYDGLISSRSRDSHTYTYSYDSHKRLVGAQYSNPDDTRADYSESYTYNAHSAMTSLYRHGIIDIAGDTPVYGVLDKLFYHYDGNRPYMIVVAQNGDALGNVFDSRAGYGDGVGDATNGYRLTIKDMVNHLIY